MTILVSIQQLITAYCWLTETPRTQLQSSSEMRDPILTLFADWESSDDIAQSDSAQTLVDLIKRELPPGSTIEDVNQHISRHYRKGVDVLDWSWYRLNSEEQYIFPSLDVKIVKACWKPRDFLEGGSVKVHYVLFEGDYLRTEIQLIGWKGHPHPQVIKTITAEEPSDQNQDSARQPITTHYRPEPRYGVET